jgi:nucleotide-binding universal stress UspA family protein
MERVVPEVQTAGLPFRKILVPVDFSRQGREAIDYAATLALASRATVYLLHVVETLSYAEQFGEVLMETSKMELQWAERLRELQTTLPPELESLVVTRSGTPFEEIVAAAQELDCDLIVMSTHGRTGLMHVLIGSTAERVARHSTRPVLIQPSRHLRH